MDRSTHVIENKLGTEKMSRLIIATGIPLMLSLLINSLYSADIWTVNVSTGLIYA